MMDMEEYGLIWQMVRILGILQNWMGEYLVQILDYIFCNIPESIMYLSVNPLTLLLDHWVIYGTHCLGALCFALALLIYIYIGERVILWRISFSMTQRCHCF